MGAGASDLAVEEASSGLGDMPELCAAEVLLRLGAPDICRLAGLNHAFRSAGAADFVWEAKLPENYRYLMGFVDGGEEKGGDQWQKSVVGKKEVYARLAKAVRFDDGKRVSLFDSFHFGFVKPFFPLLDGIKLEFERFQLPSLEFKMLVTC
jgi:hypothetical protein